LTFDDGPHKIFTPQILDILKDSGVSVSFFVCGKNVERHPEIAKRIVREGHLIGNHTYSHSKFLVFSGLLAGEIKKTNEIIEKTTGVKTKFFRPPWGIVNPLLKRYIKNLNFGLVLWDIDAKDWEKPPADIIAKRILEGAKPNYIILLHDGEKIEEVTDRSQTVLALPKIIKGFKELGFVFKTLDERE